MSVEGCALQLLRACNIRPEQLMLILQPYGGSMPTTDTEFNLLVTQLRRHGHVTEGVHGNIATVLRGPFQQARPGAYYADGDRDYAQQEGTTPNAATREVYYGEAPQATEPWAYWAAGGRNNPEPSGTEAPYSPLSYLMTTVQVLSRPFPCPTTAQTRRPPRTMIVRSSLTREFPTCPRQKLPSTFTCNIVKPDGRGDVSPTSPSESLGGT